MLVIWIPEVLAPVLTLLVSTLTLLDQGRLAWGIADLDNHENSNREVGAGSGTFVPSLLGSSNPRVLSDMGLAIPRPTRLLPALAGLGDPRSVFEWLVEIIILLLLLIPSSCPKGRVVVISSTPSRLVAAAASQRSSF